MKIMRELKTTKLTFKIRGFTLLELIAAMVVIAIIAAIGIPAYRNLIVKNKVNNSLAHLYRAINLARSESIRRNAIVSMCASIDQTKCSGEFNWREGYIIFLDPTGKGEAAPKQVIQAYPATNLNGSLTFKNSFNRYFLQFTPDGFARQNSSFHFCPNRIQDRMFAKSLVINLYGRVYFSEEVECT